MLSARRLLPPVLLLALAFAARLAILLTLTGKPLMPGGTIGAGIAQALAGTAGLWMLFEAARRLSGYGVAIAVLAVGAVFRTTAFYDAVPGTEFAGPLFVEAALLTGALAIQKKSRLWWAATVVVLVGAVAVLLSPARIGPALYAGNNPDNWTGRPPVSYEEGLHREAERRFARPVPQSGDSSYWLGEAAESMRSDPWHFLLATFRRAMLLANDWEAPDRYDLSFLRRFSWALALPWMTFGLILWPLAAAGLYLSWIERRKHVFAYLLLIGALLPALLSFVTSANRLPALPVLVFFAGYAVARWIETRRWQMRRLPLTAAIVAAVALAQANLPASTWGVGDTTFFGRHVELARWHRSHGEPVSAAAEMDRAFLLRPETRGDADLASFAGDCFQEAGREPEALELFLRVKNHVAAARCYLRLKDPLRAAGQFELAIQAEPGRVDLWLEKADAQLRAGRQQEALTTLVRAVAAFPSEGRPALAIAKVHRDRRMWREAAQAAEEAIRRDPMLREAYELREEALRNIGK